MKEDRGIYFNWNWKSKIKKKKKEETKKNKQLTRSRVQSITHRNASWIRKNKEDYYNDNFNKELESIKKK